MNGHVSVVIPTLGGNWVADTIARVNAGTVVPTEILVCIPEREAPANAFLAEPENVRVVTTPMRGQVAQRAWGFKEATAPFVLQLDDDIWLEEDALEQLLKHLDNRPGTAVGPSYHDRSDGAYHSFRAPAGKRLGVSERILYRVINGSDGYKPGQVGQAGINMGVPEGGDWSDLGWLPGGCILHRRGQLVLEAFYPFPGKAFAEDLFHSHHLRQKGVSLARCGAARATLEITTPVAPFGAALRGQLAYMRAMRTFVRMENASMLRLHAYLIFNWLDLARRRLRRAIRAPAPLASTSGLPQEGRR
jgi:GT2 family glycosyltransferase